MKISFCGQNEGSAKVRKQLKKEFPDLNIKKKDCLKKCGPCKKMLFALIQGEMVRAAGSDELYHKIIVAMKVPAVKEPAQ